MLCHHHPLTLSPLEHELLVLLMQNAERVVPVHEILDSLWKETSEAAGARFKTTLQELKKALGEHSGCIQNSRGRGYQYIATSPEARQ